MILVSIMVVAVWLGRRATEKQREELELRQRARQMRQRLDEIDDIISALLKYDGDRALLESVAEFRIRQIEKRNTLMGAVDQEAQAELAAAQSFLKSLPDLLQNHKRALPEEEHDLNYMKKLIFKGIKLIKLMQTQGQVSDIEVRDHAQRLRERMVKAEVNAYIQHGRTLLKEEDRINAAAYFKHAKEILVATNIRFPERTAMIKRISKMIWGVYSTQEDEEELDRELGLTAEDHPDEGQTAEEMIEQESDLLRDDAGRTESS
ncbi:MAG: hypothetical protein LAT62_10565 [Natronospirillum sp.]|uniref:hypothetical protein n=1 Tax=Natronospirillum sp. TaxID=2812955 RepID=UPI0025D4DFA7|nr:hypothetical protein [Natronospirillum sp.]MCH8552370.1 hypothetical protein [Natronospirillum sp.]